jgi:hypothetical protein
MIRPVNSAAARGRREWRADRIVQPIDFPGGEPAMKVRNVSKLKISRETLRDLESWKLQRIAAGLTTPVTYCNNLCTERCTYPSCHC